MGRLLRLLVVVVALLQVSQAAADLIASTSAPSVIFYEGFDGPSDIFTSGRWVKSNNDKYADQPIKLKAVASPLPGFENDKGLELTKDGSQYYGVSSALPVPISFADESKGKDFVLQYELKLQEAITCSGAYLKLPRVTSELDLSNLDNNTPYTIMFGVDKCGTDANKVHFIVQMQNPKTGEWEEKHATEVPTPKLDKKTHLYTLHISRSGDFEIFVDKKSSKKGSLLKSMNPSITPPKEISDENDKKPSDWVDDEQIPDPSDKKPDDWDESEPRRIADPKATKPANWDENAPRQVPDPKATKPDDWDDSEDGEWEAPLVDNPACDNPGCGPWSAPMISNPKYKGKWSPKKIANPAYKGKWVQKTVPNPAYFEVADPFVALPSVAGVAIEVLTNNGGIHFDNLLIGRNLADAFAVADASYGPKAVAEAVKDKKKKKDKAKKKIAEKKKSGDWRDHAEALLMQASEWVQDNMMATVGTGVALLLGIVWLVTKSISSAVDAASPQISTSQTTAPAQSEVPARSVNSNGKSRAAGKTKASKMKEEQEKEEEEEEEVEEDDEVVKTPSKSRRSARK